MKKKHAFISVPFFGLRNFIYRYYESRHDGEKEGWLFSDWFSFSWQWGPSSVTSTGHGEEKSSPDWGKKKDEKHLQHVFATKDEKILHDFAKRKMKKNLHTFAKKYTRQWTLCFSIISMYWEHKIQTNFVLKVSHYVKFKPTFYTQQLKMTWLNSTPRQGEGKGGK